MCRHTEKTRRSGESTLISALQKMCKDDQPDLLYVAAPPNIAAKTAAKYKAKHPSTKLVVDIIDLWPESSI